MTIISLSFKNLGYLKFPKYSDTQKICCNQVWTMWLYHRVMSPNSADGMANRVDTDQTAPLRGLSENLGSLQYSEYDLFYTTISLATSRLRV